MIMYLNGKPGGLFWDFIEVLRAIMVGEDAGLARCSLENLGIAPERIIQILDPTLVPINERLRPDEIEECLSRQGAYDFRRFLRGTDSDRLEKVYKEVPYAEIKYGIGDNRYIFYKR